MRIKTSIVAKDDHKPIISIEQPSLAGRDVVAPLAFELAVEVPGCLLVDSLVFPESLDAVGFEGATLEIARKLLLLQLEFAIFGMVVFKVCR